MVVKRKYPEQPCARCGHPMKVAAKNQKFCSTCKLIEWIRWSGARLAPPCPSCERKYIPILGARFMRDCGFCFAAKSIAGLRESEFGACGWLAQGTCHSGTETWLYSEHVKLCFPCLTDPAKYAANRKGILTKDRELHNQQN